MHLIGNRAFISLLIRCCVLVFAGMALASAAGSEDKPRKEPWSSKRPAPAPSPAPGAAESVAEAISETIVDQATALDFLLAGKKYTTARNESTAELKQHVSWRDLGAGFSNSTDFNLDVRLPNLEKRWALRFSSFDEDEEERDISKGVVRRRPREKRPGAALVFARQLGSFQTVFQPRLILKDPLVLNYVIRIQSHAEVGPWKVDPQLQFFADAEKGTGQFGALELSYRLSPRSTASFRSEEEYSDFENKFTTSHSLNYGYALNDTMGVGIGGSAYSSNEPVFKLDALNAGLMFTHILRRDRLRYSVSPFLDFPRAGNFRGVGGVATEMALEF